MDDGAVVERCCRAFFSQKCSRKDDVDSRELDGRKTLQAQTIGKSSEENNEFEKQRTAAIAEVAKTKEVC